MLVNAFIYFSDHFFFSFFMSFFIMKFVIIFISFFDEVSNFRKRILTNQKYELVVPNCQWNCMLDVAFRLS